MLAQNLSYFLLEFFGFHSKVSVSLRAASLSFRSKIQILIHLQPPLSLADLCFSDHLIKSLSVLT